MDILTAQTGESLVIGVHWKLFQKVADARADVKGKKGILLTRRFMAGDYVQGIVHGAGRGKLFAAAMVFANIYDKLIIHQPLEGGRFWVCGIDGGQPLQDSDFVFDDEQAAQTQTHLIRSVLKDAIVVGQHPAAEMAFTDLLAFIQKDHLRHALLERPHAKTYKAAAVAGLAVAIGGAALGAQAYISSSATQTQDMQSAYAQQIQRQAAARQLAALNKAVADSKSNLFQVPSAASQFAIWHNLVRSLPLSQEGWRPTEFSCVPAECQVKWARQQYALPSAAQRLPGTLTQADENAATTLHKLPSAALISGEPAVANLQVYLLDLAALKPRIKVMRASSDVLPALPAALSGLSSEVIGRSGAIVLSATSPLAMSLDVDALNLPGVQLQSMKISNITPMLSSMQVTAEGNYRVRL